MSNENENILFELNKIAFGCELEYLCLAKTYTNKFSLAKIIHNVERYYQAILEAFQI